MDTALNAYFVNIAESVTKHLPDDTAYTPTSKFAKYLTYKRNITTGFSVIPITVDIVHTYLKQLKSNKATGLDGISVSLIKLAGDALVLPICNIINTSINTGTFPHLWKSAKVFALHKGGSTYELNNFN